MYPVKSQTALSCSRAFGEERSPPLGHGTLENEMIFRWHDRWPTWERRRARGMETRGDVREERRDDLNS